MGGSSETPFATRLVSWTVTGYNKTGGDGVSPLVAPSGKPGSDMDRTRPPVIKLKIGPTPVSQSTISPGPNLVVKVNGVFDPVDATSTEPSKRQGHGGHGPHEQYDLEPKFDLEEPMHKSLTNKLILTPSRMNNGVQ